LPELLAVMAALRTPSGGCPWDLAQTFKTIAPYTIEEAYEVADAIESGDRGLLKEELGDLLLQVVYHARLAEEEGAVGVADVVDAITCKMLRRHPHVFGSASERAAGAGPDFWERIKAKEREKEGERSRQGAGILAGVPVALPAFARAVKLQQKAARVGFDWPTLAPVLAKLKEELAELESAAAGGPPQGWSAEKRAAVAEEFGDVLFSLANLARHLALDPEGALRAANQKFMRRFNRIEELLAAEGRSIREASLAEMERAWERAKAEEQKA